MKTRKWLRGAPPGGPDDWRRRSVGVVGARRGRVARGAPRAATWAASPTPVCSARARPRRRARLRAPRFHPAGGTCCSFRDARRRHAERHRHEQAVRDAFFVRTLNVECRVRRSSCRPLTAHRPRTRRAPASTLALQPCVSHPACSCWGGNRSDETLARVTHRTSWPLLRRRRARQLAPKEVQLDGPLRVGVRDGQQLVADARASTCAAPRASRGASSFARTCPAGPSRPGTPSSLRDARRALTACHQEAPVVLDDGGRDDDQRLIAPLLHWRGPVPRLARSLAGTPAPRLARSLAGPRRPAPLPRLDWRGPRHPAWLGRSTAPHGSCVDTMLRARPRVASGQAPGRDLAHAASSANVPAGGVGAAAPLSTMVEALPGCRT